MEKRPISPYSIYTISRTNGSYKSRGGPRTSISCIQPPRLWVQNLTFVEILSFFKQIYTPGRRYWTVVTNYTTITGETPLDQDA